MDRAEQFEEQRAHLRAVAYRMLGSAAEAEDAVQETWLRLSRVDGEVDNLGGWLRTVLSRICLDMLRTRKARREEPLSELPEHGWAREDPETEAVLADSVGRALLVVLETLAPAERIAFVLHDLFAVPFDRIAPIVDRTPVAAKKLASRARQRLRGTPASPAGELARQRKVVEAFLAAARDGNLDALLTLLAPDVVRRADPATVPPGVPAVQRGARAVAEGVLKFGRPGRFAEVALVDGEVGAVVAPGGRLRLVLTFTFDGDRVTAYEVIASPARLARLDLATLSEPRRSADRPAGSPAAPPARPSASSR
ncbi:sigma-70 family RNA polymerase sigma factor [Amycolatopsis magusensis]|uniref:sigma-70 family RNA polymerase sigma factor n=1 Tax=Amycolatopsis magusensis TaxID=882444 RepID=UPI0024A96201|nr:sigma-70 family RNA polymerase sigma factor [Amycolatopsis magusensis]MDI5976239.1 sigma-70 family RNA polymerase sigma factor [Amycolatopsis magusensis]